MRALVGLFACSLLLTSGARADAPPASPALALTQLLPGGADRCSAAQPGLLAEAERPLAALASQTERWPWSMRLPVLAYARSERAEPQGKRAVVELVRFAPRPRAEIERELARALDRPLSWADQPQRDLCAGESTCTPLHAEFVDARTVRLWHGEWGASARAESECSAMLRAEPDAIEVSARAALLVGSELRDSRSQLTRARGGLLRTTWKRYAEAEAAERALREGQRGHDELGALASVPAESLGSREADVITLRVFASFADLELALADQLRASQAAERTLAPTLSEVDLHAPDAVCSVFDAQLHVFDAQLHALDPALQARLASLLARARALEPEHEGLARRQYQLLLRSDPRAAAEVARDALRRKLGDRAHWQLAERAALARFDVAELRQRLRTAHGLSAEQAARMAQELAASQARGADYERAEWAFLTARELARAAHKQRRAPFSERFQVSELPRLLAYLGQSAHPQDDFGLHLLAFGALHAAPAPESGLWSAETSGAGRPGLVFAATSWDDAQLRALGQALAARLEQGPVELLVGLEAFASGRRATLVLIARRQGDELVIEQASRALAALPWPTLERLLLLPLRGLVGQAYPPDELTVSALDADEQLAFVRAAEHAAAVKCVLDASLVRCHGALSDATAARRALLSLLHERVADDTRPLWSGGD